MSVTHPTTTLDQAQRALSKAFRALDEIGERLTTTQLTAVWEILTARLDALEPAVKESTDRPRRPGERIIGGRRYYSATWLSDPLSSERS